MALYQVIFPNHTTLDVEADSIYSSSNNRTVTLERENEEIVGVFSVYNIAGIVLKEE